MATTKHKPGDRLKDGSYYREAPVPGARRSAHPFQGRGPRRGVNESVAANVGASVTAVGIGANIADTGALAAGDYRVIAHAASDGAVAAGKSLVLVHRNAADAADVRELGGCSPAGEARIEIPRITLAANERIRWRGGAVAHGAGEIARGNVVAIAIPS